ncbi:MAG TPA: hypothetical protein VGM91_11985 [Conexibacter sp.]|jgi:hypothetical protein
MSVFFDDLERELRRATVRRAAAARAGRLATLRRMPVAASLAALLLLALCGGGLFLVLRPHHPVIPAGTAPPVAQQAGWHDLPPHRPGWPALADEPASPTLTDSIGLLRRPQTAYDRDTAVVRQVASLLAGQQRRLALNDERAGRSTGKVLLQSVRRVSLGSLGYFWIVPTQPAEGSKLAPEPVFVGVRLHEPVDDEAGAMQMMSGDVAAALRRGIAVRVGTTTSRVVALVVPDGVASIGLDVGNGASPARSALATVHDNVAVFSLPGVRSPTPSVMPATWYDAHGRATKRGVRVPLLFTGSAWVQLAPGSGMPRPNPPPPAPPRDDSDGPRAEDIGPATG